MARENVGVVKCPFTGELSVVRKDCRGKLYYYSQAGKIAPNLPQGQKWLSENMLPLEGFVLTEIARGAPLRVAPLTQTNAVEIPLTKTPEQNRAEIPLTQTADSEEPPFWGAFA